MPKKLLCFKLTMKNFYFILCLTLGFSSMLQAAQWKIDATLDQYGGYDDNVFMASDSDKAESAPIYIITPTIYLSRLSRNWDIRADARYGYQWYFGIRDGALDQSIQRYNLSTEYRTERQTWGVTGGYSQLPNRYTAAQDTGIFDGSAKTTWHVEPSWAYKLTEKDFLELSADYSENTYDVDRFRPNTNIKAKLSWARNWTERLLVSLDALYYYYDSDTTPRRPNKFKSDNYGGTVTVDYKLSEQWSFLGHVGAYVTDADETLTLPGIGDTTISRSAVGPLADLQIKYIDELFTAAVDAGVTLEPNGNGGGLTQQVTAGLILDYKITERLTTGLDFRYYQTELASGEVDAAADFGVNDRQNIDVTPTLTYALTQDLLVSASYRYRWQKDTDSGRIAGSNLVYLTVGYDWPGISF